MAAILKNGPKTTWDQKEKLATIFFIFANISRTFLVLLPRLYIQNLQQLILLHKPIDRVASYNLSVGEAGTLCDNSEVVGCWSDKQQKSSGVPPKKRQFLILVPLFLAASANDRVASTTDRVSS